jgi:peroxisomal 3,2-trans-enoyl-CoA isomerase
MQNAETADLELTNFDLVYAHSTAYFQTPFMPLGLVPEGASSYTFPVIMGKPQANALLLAGDRLTAQEAYVGGLVTKVVDGSLDEFEEKVKEIAARVGGYSGEALGMAKRLVREGAGDAEKKKEAGERERRDLVVRFSREDTKERLAAFGNKDKAKM